MFNSGGALRVAGRTVFATVLQFSLIALAGMSGAATSAGADISNLGHDMGAFTVCKQGCRYDRIQEAVDAARSGATISIGPGTYFENVVIDKKSLALVGLAADATTVDGRFRGPVFILGPYPQAGAAGDLSVTLRGMTITHGRGVTGGGVVQNVLTFVLTDSVVVSNVASQSGGGLEAQASSVTPTGALTTRIENCVITNNRAPQGAGIFVEPEVGLQITNSLIAHNTGDDGAGIFASYASNVDVTGTTVSNNSADGDGGGIWIAHFHQPGVPYTNLSLQNTAVVNNTAANSCGGIAVAENLDTICQAGGPGVIVALNQPEP